MEEIPMQVDPEAAMAAAAAMMVVMLLIFAGCYAYFAVCLMSIAKKTNTPNGWMAWIPIANVILMLQIAGKPIWWIILMLIPLVGVIIAILVWMGIAEARGKPGWMGALIVLIPIVNLILLGYLAFSNGGQAQPAAA